MRICAALARSLLVIDEVHASDSWMTRIQQGMVDAHCALGGHTLLMSATLGASARAGWRGVPLPSFDQARREPYPAVWTRRDCHPVTADPCLKTVALQALDRWSGADAAELALAAAGQGARALVIRNTVDRARETWHACVDAARSRKGEEGVILTLPDGTIGPLGRPSPGWPAGALVARHDRRGRGHGGPRRGPDSLHRGAALLLWTGWSVARRNRLTGSTRRKTVGGISEASINAIGFSALRAFSE